MVLAVDVESDDYRFYRSLNEDVQIKPDALNRWDLQMENGDYVNVAGNQSLHNAICIAIMTRYGELKDNPLYEEFGCHLHELIKANKSPMVEYKIELFVIEILEKMRRILEVNWIEVTDSEDNAYKITFNVTSINDEIVEGSVEI
ncbi:hypothetical protein [Methanobrevibacter sp.]|uniref:hypothetical protein n=1 Tax=Methanobrevibacter sp. TaxID=66852 RepID=UPI00388EAA9C